MRNVFCYDSKIVDLTRLREDAAFYLNRGGWTGENFDSTTIHYHKAGEPCEGRGHEVYEMEDEE